MNKDIVPELLEKLENEFVNKYSNNKKINNAVKKIKTGKATHQDSNEFAYECGKILAEVFKGNISPEDLPDGKMYYNIADRVLNDTLGRNYKLISDYSADVQTSLNKSSGLRIKGVKPPKNQDRINGLIEKVQEKTYEETKWVLQEPIINFSQSIVDDTIKTNVDFHNKLGLRPKIVRKMNGKCCDWCKEVEGEYEYPNVPKDVFRRHRFCRCTVEYEPGNGKRQNVHTKKWQDIDNDEKIEKRKNTTPDFYADPNSRVFKKEHKKYIGRSNYDKLMKQYKNEESRKYIRTAYRKSANIGDGSTYAIRKMEIETGLNLGRNGRNHSKKVEDLIRQINKSMSKEIPEKDKRFLEKELERLMTVK